MMGRSASHHHIIDRARSSSGQQDRPAQPKLSFFACDRETAANGKSAAIALISEGYGFNQRSSQA